MRLTWTDDGGSAFLFLCRLGMNSVSLTWSSLNHSRSLVYVLPTNSWNVRPLRGVEHCSSECSFCQHRMACGIGGTVAIVPRHEAIATGEGPVVEEMGQHSVKWRCKSDGALAVLDD